MRCSLVHTGVALAMSALLHCHLMTFVPDRSNEIALVHISARVLAVDTVPNGKIPFMLSFF